MKKELMSAVLISSLFIVGCSNNQFESINYTEKLKTDLILLSQGPWDSNINEANYTISFSHSLTSDELGHVYTVDIGYLDEYIDDIHVIVLPGSFISNPLEHNVPHVGYSQRINLAKEKNQEKNDRENIRLQIELVDAEENIYVSVTYSEEVHYYKF